MRQRQQKKNAWNVLLRPARLLALLGIVLQFSACLPLLQSRLLPSAPSARRSLRGADAAAERVSGLERPCAHAYIQASEGQQCGSTT